MKEKVIETVGRTWQTLGQKGEVSIPQLSKFLKEKESLVCLALGWLSREDKINYRVKNNQMFVSLAENELQSFKNTSQTSQQSQNKPIKARRLGLIP